MKRFVLILVTTALLVLSLAAVAQATTTTTTTPRPPDEIIYSPQDIYDDYADNRHLDRDYTDAELQAYLDDPTIRVYLSRGVWNPLDNLVRRILGIKKNDPSMSFADAYKMALGGASTGPTTDYPDTFPFTGFEVLLALGGGLLLLAGGFAARRATR